MDLVLLSLAGLGVLYLIISFAVRFGIDSSKQVRSLRKELHEIKKQLKDIESSTKE
ncbi:hypothetical protein [Ureibacillus chungkukjangi]|uniref:Uncharacterized protein n=1 Tax=Ureibacillus chungkukjangi TaxID=1202712 RepID=A0A318TZS5_9BACL|nr:hypothetical protein [Ureibacillus chungkukjangi]MCM3389382.1 hypothetical protein [Ureibacillus chungkukjangi]PYF05149.1 hypothetical protein BJ095_11923 [Ureibacillus chungkukjangi]